MRIKPLALLAALALTIAVAIGCGDSDSGSGSTGSDMQATGATGGEPKRIMTFLYAPRGFNDVTKAWSNGFDAAQAELGDSVEIEQKATGKVESDPATYVNFIKSALAQQPDGIVVVPNNAAAMASALQQIADDGTKVLIMDQDVADMPGKVAFVGTDNVEAGRTAAEWMVQQHEDGNLKSTEVAVLASAPGISSTDDRLKGFLEAIEGSGLKVVAKTAPECNDGAEGRAAMADMLTAHPDLGGVFSVCDVIALGAAQALKAQDKLDVKQVSIDASTAGVNAILDKAGIDAEVAQHLLRVGQESATTLAAALAGEQVPANVDTGTDLVTAENAKEYLATAAEESK